MDPRHAFGREAERRAELFYQQRGYSTLARNFRAKAGEIDLVLEKNGLLLFVEVKGRGGEWEQGAWAPSWRGKGRRLRAAIGVYLAAHPQIDYREIRIEIVFVTPTRVEARYEGI
jgi:putative endonuclease